MSTPRPRIARSGRGLWARRYPPLVTLAVALAITLIVLPSALTLPNANPTTVLEYAPVPPEKDEPPPPQTGSISQLGLGTTSSLTTGAPEIGPVDLPTGKGLKPITKRCVGRPLRQTEDPNSPPCVPFHEGDNGGETWQGVTKDEIVVLVYASTVTRTGGTYGAESPPSAGSYCDVDGPPNTDSACLDANTRTQDHFEVRITRAFSRYFNERFQTYGRKVHFWVYYSGASSPAGRRADASDNYERLKPFAVIDHAIFGGHNSVYAEAITTRNVSVFGSFVALPSAYYRRFAPFVWGFWPDIEHWAEQYSSYVCEKIAPHPNVAYAGGGLTGKPRRYALMSAADETFPGLEQFADLVKEKIRSCPNGAKVTPVEEVVFPHHQYSIDPNPEATTKARENVAKMAAAGVTTVLWLGGYEVEHSKAAAAQNWFPEWIVAGDLTHDEIEEARYQQQDAWRYARVASNQLREDRAEDSPCRMSYREAEPGGPDTDPSCQVYSSFFQLFKSIQVAGPNLTPYSVDQGQHAIQRQASSDPHTAACFYDPGDYTCVKDMHEAWWDPDAPDPDGDPDEKGCWRMVREGERALPGQWRGTDRDAFANKADPCNVVGDNTVSVNADRL